MTQELFAYAVVGAGAEARALARAGLFAIEENGLAALARRVPGMPRSLTATDSASPSPEGAGAAGDETTREADQHLADLTACHHAIGQATEGAVLPLSTGAIFAGEAPLRDWLRSRGARLTAALADIDGCAEWLLLLDEDEAVTTAWLRGTNRALAASQRRATRARAALLDIRAPAVPTGTPGASRPADPAAVARLAVASRAAQAASRAQRRFDDAMLHARQTHIATATLAVGVALEQHVRCASTAPARGAAGVAAWSMLLRDSALPELRATLDEAGTALAESGLTLRLSGPWPPYDYGRRALTDG